MIGWWPDQCECRWRSGLLRGVDGEGVCRSLGGRVWLGMGSERIVRLHGMIGR